MFECVVPKKYITGLHTLVRKYPRFITSVMIDCLSSESDTSNAAPIEEMITPQSENPVAAMRLIVTLHLGFLCL